MQSGDIEINPGPTRSFFFSSDCAAEGELRSVHVLKTSRQKSSRTRCGVGANAYPRDFSFRVGPCTGTVLHAHRSARIPAEVPTLRVANSCHKVKWPIVRNSRSATSVATKRLGACACACAEPRAQGTVRWRLRHVHKHSPRWPSSPSGATVTSEPGRTALWSVNHLYRRSSER